MERKKSALPIFIFLIHISALVYGQKILYPEIHPVNERFDNFLIRNGEADQTSTTIMFDKKGFLWSGTETSLYRFDGVRYVEFMNNDKESTGFYGNPVTSLFEDSKGSVWVGTAGALNRLNTGTGEFSHFFPDPDGRLPVNNLIKLIREDDDGILWIMTNGNIFSFDPATSLFTEYETHKASWRDDMDNYGEEPERFLSDRSGNLWFGSHYGLYCYNRNGKNFRMVYPGSGDSCSAREAFITCVAEESSGSILFAALNGSVFRIKSADGKPELLDLKPDKNSLPAFNSVTAIIEDRSKKLWFFGDRAFIVHDPVSGSSETWKISFDKARNFRPGRSSILIDEAFNHPDGAMWFVHKGNGIMYRFDRDAEKLSLYKVPAYILYRCIMDDSGIFWFGCARNNIYRLSTDFPYSSIPVLNSSWAGLGATGKITSGIDGDIWIILFTGIYKIRTLDPYSSPGLEKIKFKGEDSLHVCIFRDKNEGLWFGGRRGSVLFRDPATELTVRYNLVHPRLSMAQEVVQKICEDAEGNIWAATTSSGLFRFSRASKNFHHVIDYGDLPGSPTEPLSDFLISSDGKIWLLNYLGVYSIRISDWKISDYSATARRNKLTQGYYSRIKEDIKGNIWLLNFNKGLFLYNRENDAFSPVAADEEMKGASFYDLVSDSLGKLWISCSNGLILFDPANDVSFKIKMPKLQYDVQGYQVPGRMIYINEGYLYVFNLNIPLNKTIPDIFITGLEINGKRYNTTTGLNEDIRSAGKITLKHKDNSLRIEFSAINYLEPKNNAYRYFMKGVDDDTVYSGNINFAEYKKLGPGNLTFWVSGANNNGLWNDTGTRLDIHIKPPYYRTFLAWVIYSLIIVSVIGGYIRFRITSVRRENVRLENEVRQRTAELEIKNRQLEDIDRMKSRFFTDISHEIRTPLSLILGPLDLMLGENHFDSKTGHLLELMKRNGQRLMQLITQMLDISKLDSGRMKIALSESDISLFLRLLVYEFVSLAESRKIKYIVELPDKIHVTFFDEDKLEKIISNLLTNAFKFTEPGGTVKCESKIVPGNMPGVTEQLIFRVEDTGEGIDAANIDRIFDRFYRAETEVDHMRDGTGVGLSLTKELVELCHGSINVKSQKDKGSVFEVTIPLGKEHLSRDEYFIPAAHHEKKYEIGELNRWKDFEPVTGENGSDQERYRILVVEDNDDLRGYINENLQEDFTVINADNGRDGLNLGYTLVPDLVITDIMMKGLDGIALCRSLKNDVRTSHIPVIMLTARSTIDDKITGLSAGADDYLVKPFSLAELKVRISNLLIQRDKLKLKYSNIYNIDLKEDERESVDDRFIRKAVKIINENIHDFRFNVGTLQEKLGMSRTHLFRKVKVLTGMAPVILLRNMRLEKAARLLDKKSGNIAEIANSVGISNPSYFTKCFREHFGVTPREYQSGLKSQRIK